MIRLKSKDCGIKPFIDYLNLHYNTKEDVILYITYGFDSVIGPDGSIGFAAYDTESKTIYCADSYEIKKSLKDEEINGIPRYYLETIAHEFRHHLQFTESKMNLDDLNILEDDAELFAVDIVKRYINEKY